MKDKRLFLRSVHVDEALVQDYMDQAVDIFKLNTVGPQKYLQSNSVDSFKRALKTLRDSSIFSCERDHFLCRRRF